MKIILLRHGKVNISYKKKLYAKEMEEWIKEYNYSSIFDVEVPLDVKYILTECDVFVCSELQRSQESLVLCKRKFYVSHAFFNEVDLPYGNWGRIKFSVSFWLVFFRILWFLRYSANGETFEKGKLRGKEATQKLIGYAENKKGVLLVGHGIMNQLIGRELIKRGWKCKETMKNHPWSYTVFEF